ncbi:MAG: hypothetical protein Kow0059_09690 [Candidatus Sumerlaeia bacterium]
MSRNSAARPWERYRIRVMYLDLFDVQTIPKFGINGAGKVENMHFQWKTRRMSTIVLLLVVADVPARQQRAETQNAPSGRLPERA